MKHKHILLILLTVIVVGYMFFFDFFGLKLDPDILLVIIIALPVLAWAALFGTAKDPELTDYPEIRIFAFLIGIVACIPLAIHIVGRYAELYIWVINALIIIAAQVVIMVCAFFEGDTVAAHHHRSQVSK
jgi:4-amino-4-deoxy-L-arabinose transferase-like glycosyltransferase